MTTEQTQQPPTPEEMAKMQQVAQAGAEAGASAGTQEEGVAASKQAMRSKADEVKLELSDEQIEAIADTFVAKAIAQFEQRGAFDAPPEPVRPPETPQAPPPPNEQAAGAAAAETPPPAPQKRTWAHKFMGQ